MKPCKNGVCSCDGDDYKCTCHKGFSGRDCEIDDDDCKNKPCGDYGICYDRVNGYECRCEEGY